MVSAPTPSPSPAPTVPSAPGRFGPWLQLHSGVPYDVGENRCEGLSFDKDVAYPLSRIHRFLGHTREAWSVAAHAVGAARLGRALSMPVVTQYLALHHDDHEALIGDIPGPIKSWLHNWDAVVAEALDELEMQAQTAISMAIKAGGGLSLYVTDAQADQIRYLDRLMLAAEARILKASPPRSWGVSNLLERDVEAAAVIVRDILHNDRNFGQRAMDSYIAHHYHLNREIQLAE
jgi:hypothetical protein